jgi:hypothetical protein
MSSPSQDSASHSNIAEEWRDVVGYEGFYMVSNRGAVKSCERTIQRLNRWGQISPSTFKEKHIKPRLHTGGYHYVSLCVNSKPVNHYIHRMVLQAFIGEPAEGQECRHLNGIHTDNRLENLQWNTHSVNMDDQYTHGTRALGGKVAGSFLSESDVLAIREKYSLGGVTQDQLAAEYKTTQTNIGLIVRGKNWAHVGGEITKKAA